MPLYPRADCNEQEFMRLLFAHSHHGGLSPLVPGRVSPDQDPVTFCWGGLRWAPNSQFEPDGCTLCAPAQRLLGELRPAIDGVDLVRWLAEPSPWLDGCAPLALLHRDTERVLAAARIDRFIVDG
jgi:hypothetical protein